MEAIEKACGEILSANNIFIVKSITNVNHKPHPFMVGSKHVVHAHDHHSGMLGEATLKAIPCAHRGCTSSYDQHTHDKVLFLQLTRDVKNNEASLELKKLLDIMAANKIDGIAFVEADEKYRISDD